MLKCFFCHCHSVIECDSIRKIAEKCANAAAAKGQKNTQTHTHILNDGKIHGSTKMIHSPK